MRPGFWVLGLTLLTALPPPARGQDLPPRLTLAEATQLALDHHPALAAAQARTVASEGLVKQATLRANPTFSLQSENWRFTGTPGFDASQELEVAAYLSQPLLTGGKRSLRAEVARSGVEMARLQKEVVRWKIRGEVRLAYWTALMARQEVALLDQTYRHLEGITRYHRIQVEQGAMAEAELIRVQLEEDRLALAIGTAEFEAERRLLDLLKAMGVKHRTGNIQLVEVPPGPSGAAVSTLESLIRLSLENRPEIGLARAQLERAREELLLQEAHARPDWDVILGYKRADGYDTLMAGISVPLPFFGRNQGNISFRSGELARAESLLEVAAREVQAEVVAALSGLRRRREMVTRMETGMLDRADESLRIALAAYQEGATELLRLLDAQRTQSEIRLLESRTQMNYQINLVRLEAAVGVEDLRVGEELMRATP